MGTILVVRKGTLSVLLALTCLGIAACGSSGSSSTVRVLRPSPVTKTSFDAQVGSLCGRANSAFGAAKGTKAQVAVISHYLAVFRSVKAPSQLKALYSQYLAVLTQELSALRRGDSAQLFSLARTRARPLARQLGATGCIT